jgi:hypothetical protein
LTAAFDFYGMQMNRRLTVASALLVATIAGCGSGNPWDTVAVSGKVAYEDGTVVPAQSIRLFFAPQTPPADSKTYPRQGVADVSPTDGKFDSVTTYKYADGLITGKHKVVVVAFDGGRNLSQKVPKEYTSVATTPLEIDTADSPLEIKISKP